MILLLVRGGREGDVEGKCMRLHIPFTIIFISSESLLKWPVVAKGEKTRVEFLTC